MTIRVNLSAGFGLTQNGGGGWLRLARDCETIGYDHLVVADHLSPGGATAFASLAAAAAVTSTLRVGTYVLNNDLRHPVVVAHEVAAIADLSGGRMTLGLGAGHMKSEYDQAGIAFDPPGRRVARMAESATVLPRLLAGGPVTFEGLHYVVREHEIREPDAAPVRLLIGGNGTTVLRTAGRLADTVGFTGFAPNHDGSGVDITHFTEVGLAERITVARVAAGDRWPLPIDVLVQAVIVTDRAEVEAERIAARFKLPVEAVKSSPFILIGSTASIAERLQDLHARLGVSSVTVFANRSQPDQTERTMAPVIELLA